MRNLFIITILYLLLSLSQAWSLPTCPGSPETGEVTTYWDNCVGTYTLVLPLLAAFIHHSLARSAF